MTEPHQRYVSIGSGNGLVPSGNGPLPEPMLTKISRAEMALLCDNELKYNPNDLVASQV